MTLLQADLTPARTITRYHVVHTHSKHIKLLDGSDVIPFVNIMIPK